MYVTFHQDALDGLLTGPARKVIVESTSVEAAKRIAEEDWLIEFTAEETDDGPQVRWHLRDVTEEPCVDGLPLDEWLADQPYETGAVGIACVVVPAHGCAQHRRGGLVARNLEHFPSSGAWASWTLDPACDAFRRTISFADRAEALSWWESGRDGIGDAEACLIGPGGRVVARWCPISEDVTPTSAPGLR